MLRCSKSAAFSDGCSISLQVRCLSECNWFGTLLNLPNAQYFDAMLRHASLRHRCCI